MSLPTSWRQCNPGAWTNLYEAPSFGFIYLWSSVPVNVQWRRYSSGPPWYSSGTVFLSGAVSGSPGKTTIFTGLPSGYTKIDVNPAFSAVLRVT